MLRPGRRSLVLALAAAALGISACGSGEEATIPPENADALLAQLDEVETAVSQHDCSSAQTDISQLSGAVDQLPAGVGVETKEGLRELVANLSKLTATQCDEPSTGGTGLSGAQPPPEETTEEPAVVDTTEEPPPEDIVKEEQPSDEGTGVPGGSDTGPPGPEGNPNDDGSSGGIGGD